MSSRRANSVCLAAAMLAACLASSMATPIIPNGGEIEQTVLVGNRMLRVVDAQEEFCHSGIPYNATYSGVALQQRHFMDVNGLKGLVTYTRPTSNKQSKLVFEFASAKQAAVAAVELKQLISEHEGDSFVHGMKDSKGKDILFRALLVKLRADETSLVVLGEIAGLGDVFHDLDLTIMTDKRSHRVASCMQSAAAKAPMHMFGDEHDKDFCLGLNVDHDDCKSPDQTIDLYSWSQGVLSVDVTCSDCFAGLSGEVFVNIVIQTGRLAKAEAGFRKLKLESAFVLDILATADYNVGVDKDLALVPPKTLFSFNVLTVPVEFWFQIPVHVYANLELSAQGEITAGFTSSKKWDDGMFFVWTKDHPDWKIDHESPKSTTFTPVFNGSAQANANAELTVQPSIQFYLDRVFHTNLDLIPDMTANAQWSTDTRQLCGEVDYDVKLQATANFDADVSWLGIHEHKQWGPYVFFDTGSTELAQVCVPL